MKGYVGIVLQIPESMAVGLRCIESGRMFDIDVIIEPAVYKEFAMEQLEYHKLKLSKWDESYSSIGAVVGNFITQYRCWKHIVENDEPGIVLEHDAIFVGPIPDLTGKGDIINLGKPSFGKFKSQNQPGVYPMFSKTGGYIPGAHGYYLTPKGAQQLIDKAKVLGATPCDLFLNKTNFPDIKELYPWPIEADDSFTTIQKEKGCGAKHNYNEDYKIIE